MSIWNRNEINTDKETLNKDLKIDTLIIGGGMTGMTTSYYLKDYKNFVVVDANIIGHGVTLNTTAKINYFQERVYTKIAKITNEKMAKIYLESQIYAIDLLKEIINKEKIDCDFKKVPSYVFANKVKEIKYLKKEIEFLKKNNINVYEKEMPNKIMSVKSYCVDDTYIFNPIKYLNGIYNILKKYGIKIYENTKIIKIEQEDNKYICYGNNFKISVDNIILACHYPFFIIPFLLPLKSSIEKSYIIVSKVNKDLGFTCISSSMPTYSTRFYSDKNNIYQICLAESHNTAIKQNDEYHFNKVKKIFNLKEKNIIECYSNVDIMTPDHMPYIGKLKQNMYIGCGYNTWGMTNSVLAAKILSDNILNKENKYNNIFDPNRFNLANFIKLPIIVASQTKSFFGPKINKNKYWYKNISFINKNGKSLAIYKDDNNKEHIVYNKCPHLGCSLIFNNNEKTWDCPCHSSRFDINGKCIKGPSNYDISYKNK